MGGPPPAGLRGRPARLSHLPRRDAHRRLHHATVGDRPDPHPPLHPRGTRGPRRRAEPPIDAGPREPRGVTRPTPARRRPDRPVSTPPRCPAPPRGRSACAAVPPQRPHGPHRLPPAPGHPSGPQAEQPAKRTGAVAVAPTPAHQRSQGRGPGPILPPPRLNFLSGEFPIRQENRYCCVKKGRPALLA